MRNFYRRLAGLALFRFGRLAQLHRRFRSSSMSYLSARRGGGGRWIRRLLRQEPAREALRLTPRRGIGEEAKN